MRYLVAICVLAVLGLLLISSLDQIEEVDEIVSGAQATAESQVVQEPVTNTQAVPNWLSIPVIIAVAVGITWAASRRRATEPYNGPVDTTPIRTTGAQGESSRGLLLLIGGVVLAFAFLCALFFSLL